MKLLVISITLLLMPFAVFGQQDPLHSNYRFNYFILNPAAAGANAQFEFNGSYLGSFRRFPGGPATYTLSANGFLGKEGRTGLGVNFVNDNIGSQRLTGLQLAYAYHLPLGPSRLSFGLAGRMVIDNKAQIFRNQHPNPNIIFSNQIRTDFSLGTMYYDPNGYLGISFQNIARIGEKEIFGEKVNISVSGAYKFHVSKYLAFEPVGLLKYSVADQPIIQYDINFRAHLINELILLGLGYRGGNYNNFFALMGGINIKDKFRLFYSYDFILSSFHQYSWGSHELTMGIQIGKRNPIHNNKPMPTEIN